MRRDIKLRIKAGVEGPVGIQPAEPIPGLIGQSSEVPTEQKLTVCLKRDR